MKYAQRLGVSIPNSLSLRKTTKVLGAHVLSDNEVGLVRHYVNKETIKKILKLFPIEVSKYCLGINLSQIHPLLPHVHTDEHCVINMYIEAECAQTVFYEGETRVATGVTRDNGNKYFALDGSLLRVAEGFKASSGEVWLLNSRQPHAVLQEGEGSHRWAIQIFLDKPFEDIKQLFGAYEV